MQYDRRFIPSSKKQPKRKKILPRHIIEAFLYVIVLASIIKII